MNRRGSLLFLYQAIFLLAPPGTLAELQTNKKGKGSVIINTVIMEAFALKTAGDPFLGPADRCGLEVRCAVVCRSERLRGIHQHSGSRVRWGQEFGCGCSWNYGGAPLIEARVQSSSFSLPSFSTRNVQEQAKA